MLLREGAVRELGGTGTPLGFLDPEDFHLSEAQVQFKPGDRLVMYTDGMSDVLSAEGRLSDQAALKALLRACSGLPVEAICQTIFDRLAEYQGEAEQYDDMTMLVLGVE